MRLPLRIRSYIGPHLAVMENPTNMRTSVMRDEQTIWRRIFPCNSNFECKNTAPHIVRVWACVLPCITMKCDRTILYGNSIDLAIAVRSCCQTRTLGVAVKRSRSEMVHRGRDKDLAT